jgi:hypothetical protein
MVTDSELDDIAPIVKLVLGSISKPRKLNQQKHMNILIFMFLWS